jgi:hypothetical protein
MPRSKTIAEWRDQNPLRQWMDRQEVHFGLAMRVARFCKISKQALYKWLSGMAYPSSEHFGILSQMTGGAVNYKAWQSWQNQKPSANPRKRRAVRS